MELAGIMAGLGNPGPQYEGSRHNMGFWALDLLMDELQRQSGGAVEELSGGKFRCRLWRLTFPGSRRQWLAVKPLTFMNLSGESVQPLMAWYRLEAEQLLVAHDELDLAPGRIQLKKGGGAAGHNGLKSLMERLGGQDFYRLRLGVGRAPDPGNTVSWVLGRPGAEDWKLWHAEEGKVKDALRLFALEGPQKAMGVVNVKTKQKKALPADSAGQAPQTGKNAADSLASDAEKG